MKARIVLLLLPAILLTACHSNPPVRSEPVYYPPAQAQPIYGVYPVYGDPDYRPYPVYRPRAPAGPDINRQLNQADRSIEKGARQGKLTDSEERRLEGQLDRIEDRANQMKSDGRFTQRERREIQEDINHLQRNIRQEKQDRERQR
ncbi:hypothetical protein MASR1M60_24160 [Rhodocyclaceae bacterium]